MRREIRFEFTIEHDLKLLNSKGVLEIISLVLVGGGAERKVRTHRCISKIWRFLLFFKLLPLTAELKIYSTESSSLSTSVFCVL